MQAPFVAETERLRLRDVEITDFDFLFGLFRHPEVMKHYGCLRDEAQTREWIRFSRANLEKYGHGKWIILRREGGIPIGHCGLVSTEVDGVSEVELGYFLGRAYWGMGYATEAAKAAIRLGFETFGYDRIISAIVPANGPSIHVARRLGMAREERGQAVAGRVTWDAEIYSISCERWAR